MAAAKESGNQRREKISASMKANRNNSGWRRKSEAI
jgi:hypothetical protein